MKIYTKHYRPETPVQIVWAMILKRKILIISTFVILFFLPIAYLTTRYQSKTEAAWLDDHWGYRQAINFTENSGNAVNYLPIKISLTSLGSKAQSDCDDIRVTDAGGKIIPSQVETCDTANTTVVWIQDNVTASARKTYFIYYGNPSAPAPNFSSTDSTLTSTINTTTHAYTLRNALLRLGGDEDNTSGTIRNLVDVTTGLDSAQTAISNDRVDYNYEGALGGDSYGVVGTTTLSNSGPLFRKLSWNETQTGYAVNKVALVFANFPVAYLRYRITNNSGGQFSFNSAHHSMTESGRCYSFSGAIRCSAAEGDTVGGDAAHGWFIDSAGPIGMCKIRSANTTTAAGWRSNGSPSPALTLNNGEQSGWYEYYLRPITTSAQCDTYANIMYTQQPTISASSEQKSLGPVAYWRFDEGYGANTKDSSPNGKTGTISGATWKPESECFSGKCLYFDGNDTVTNSTFGFIPTSGTISLWQKTPYAWADAPGANDLWLAQIRNSDSTSYVAFENYTPGDSLQFKYYHSSTYHTNQGITPAFSAATWHQITMTFETDSVKLYVDGVLRSTDTAATMLGSALDYLVAGYQYTGYMDELKVYNYVRTASQIKADYASKNSGSTHGTSAALGVSLINNDALSNSLVGYWKMDENTGTTVADASGNGGTMTFNGTYPPVWTTGKFGAGISQDGANTVATVPNSTTLNITGTQISYGAWVYVTATPASYGSVLQKGGNPTGYRIMITSSGGVLGQIAAQSTFSNAALSQNAWNHVFVTYDGISIKMYINGVLQNNPTAYTGSIGDNSSSALSFGKTEYPAFTGREDEARIYNRALSAREVRDLYAFAPGPVGYWGLNEGSGISANDQSGNGITGTLQSSPAWISGKFGKGLNFNGTTQNITTSSNPLTYFTASKGYTVESWVKLDQYQPAGGPGGCCGSRIAYTNAGDGGFDWRIWNSGTVQFYRPTTWCSASSSVTVPLNQWVHMAATYNNQQVYVYMNGVQIASTNSCNFLDSTAGVTFNYPGGNHGLYGSMDELMVYNYARSQKQIVEDMNAGHPVGGSPVGSQVSYWKLDEGYSNIAYDSIGRNNGTLTSSPAWSNLGKFGKALSFNGNSGYVNVGDPADGSLDFNASQSFSVTFWIKTASHTSWMLPIWKGGSSLGTQGYDFEIATSGRIDYNHSDTVIYRQVQATGYNVADDQWHHIAGVTDRSASKMYLYIDGKRVTSGTDISTLGTLASANIFYIRQPSYNINGLIDEVKVYGAALTEDEIKLDYNRGASMVLGTMSDTSGLTGGSIASSSATASYCVPGGTDSCTPPVGEWNFEEKTGTNAYDTSGNNLVGSLASGPTWTSGKVGSGINFDGSDDNVNTGDNTVIDLSTTGTLEVWAKSDRQYPSDTGSDFFRNFISKSFGGGGTQVVYSFHWYGNNASSFLRFCIGDGASANCPDYNLGPLTIGQWNKYAVTWNTADTTVKWYINGRLVETDANTIVAQNSGTNLYIGGCTFGCGANQNWDGVLDQAKVFNYARTQAQIAYDYNRGGPVGHWKFDECQGITANDSSGNGNSGTITIGATVPQTSVGTCTVVDTATAWYNGATGKYNSSLNFDGVDDFVDVGSYSSLNNVGDNISVSAWVKTSIGSGLHTIVGRGNDWRLNKSGNVYQFEHRNSNNVIVYPAGTETSTNWVHVVGTYARDTFARLYINGVLVDSDAQTLSTRVSQTQNQIGNSYAWHGDGTYNDYWWNGQIDDVRIYNYALTPIQVKQLYNQGSSIRFGPSTGAP